VTLSPKNRSRIRVSDASGSGISCFFWVDIGRACESCKRLAIMHLPPVLHHVSLWAQTQKYRHTYGMISVNRFEFRGQR
jgi:hypothetical protein